MRFQISITENGWEKTGKYLQGATLTVQEVDFSPKSCHNRILLQWLRRRFALVCRRAAIAGIPTVAGLGLGWHLRSEMQARGVTQGAAAVANGPVAEVRDKVVQGAC